MPRSGTNRLVAQLQAQSDIWCHGEVLQIDRVFVTSPSLKWKKEFPPIESELLSLRRSDPCAFFEKVYSMNYGRDHCGIKTLFGERQDVALTKSVLENKAIAKIVVHRTNVLASYSSYNAAIQDDAWNLKKMERTPRSKVKFSEAMFSQYRSRYEERVQKIFVSLQGQEYFVLRYDELNLQARLAALLRFLGACSEVAYVETPAVRGSRDVLSRFSNPEVAETFLHRCGLTHWSHENDVKDDLYSA